MCICAYIDMFICAYVHIQICSYVHIYVHMVICVYVNVFLFTQLTCEGHVSLVVAAWQIGSVPEPALSNHTHLQRRRVLSLHCVPIGWCDPSHVDLSLPWVNCTDVHIFICSYVHGIHVHMLTCLYAHRCNCQFVYASICICSYMCMYIRVSVDLCVCN